MPKRGFNNAAFKTKVAIVNLNELDALADGGAINEATLREKGLIRGKFTELKVLGTGDVTKKINIEVDTISASAREKIEAVGGTVTIREKKSVVVAPAKS